MACGPQPPQRIFQPRGDLRRRRGRRYIQPNPLEQSRILSDEGFQLLATAVLA